MLFNYCNLYVTILGMLPTTQYRFRWPFARDPSFAWATQSDGTH